MSLAGEEEPIVLMQMGAVGRRLAGLEGPERLAADLALRCDEGAHYNRPSDGEKMSITF